MSAELEVTAIEDAPAAGDNRPVRYVIPGDLPDSEVVIYRASGIGGCERAMVASARSYPPRATPDKFEAIFAEGHLAEPQILAMYEEQFGVQVTARQLVVLFEVGEINDRRVVVRGAIDGLVQASGQVTLIDAKKFRPSTWDKFMSMGVECQPNYPWQFAAYQWALMDMMPGIEVPAYIVGGRWVDGKVVEIARKPVLTPPIPKNAIRLKVAKVERLIGQGYDPGEVACAGSYPCPWWYLHDGAEGVVKPAKAVVDVELAELATDWLMRKGLEAKATKEAGQLKKATDDTKQLIMARMRQLGLVVNEPIDVGGVVIDWSETPVKARAAGVQNNFNVKQKEG